jgi:plastocyanin
MKIHHILVPLVGFALLGCGGGSSGGGGGSTTVNETVNMTGTHSYAPTNVMVHAGDVIRWSNTDSARHTVTSDTGTPGLDSSPSAPAGVAGGRHFDWTVPAGTAAGTVFYYHCEFHGAAGSGSALGAGMAGSITVQ